MWRILNRILNATYEMIFRVTRRIYELSVGRAKRVLPPPQPPPPTSQPNLTDVIIDMEPHIQSIQLPLKLVDMENDMTGPPKLDIHIPTFPTLNPQVSPNDLKPDSTSDKTSTTSTTSSLPQGLVDVTNDTAVASNVDTEIIKIAFDPTEIDSLKNISRSAQSNSTMTPVPQKLFSELEPQVLKPSTSLSINDPPLASTTPKLIDVGRDRGPTCNADKTIPSPLLNLPPQTLVLSPSTSASTEVTPSTPPSRPHSRLKPHVLNPSVLWSAEEDLDDPFNFPQIPNPTVQEPPQSNPTKRKSEGNKIGSKVQGQRAEERNENSQTSNPKSSKKKRSKRRKTDEPEGSGGPPRPNFFVAFQVSNPDIKCKIREMQSKMLDKELTSPSILKVSKTGLIFKDTMVPPDKLHFTLHVFNLKDQEEQMKAIDIVESCYLKYKDEFEKNPLTIKIQGVGHFRNSVLFAKIKGEDEISKLEAICDTLRAQFDGINIIGDSKVFKPHMTIAKMSRSKKLHKKKVRSFPVEMWSEFEFSDFGEQGIESLQLLSMTESDPVTGYYRSVAQFNFTNNTSQQTQPPINSSPCSGSAGAFGNKI